MPRCVPNGSLVRRPAQGYSQGTQHSKDMLSWQFITAHKLYCA